MGRSWFSGSSSDEDMMIHYSIRPTPLGWLTSLLLTFFLWIGGASAESVPTPADIAKNAVPVVADVRIDINGAENQFARYTAMARALIDISPGDPLTADTLMTNTERLKLCREFATIHVDSVTRDDGEAIVFSLTPCRRVRAIHIRGNYPIFKGAVRNQMTLFAGDPFTDADLTEQAAAITKRFERAGYIAPEVSVKAIDERPDGTSALQVDIVKGAPYLPGRVTFTGNRAISDRALKWRLDSWRSVLLFGSGRFSEYQLKKDLEGLTTLYHRKGFVDAELDYRIDRIGPYGRVDVTVTIDEGARYRVTFAGNDHFWDLTLKKDMIVFESGNRNGRGVRRSIRNMRQRYHQAGFADVVIEADRKTLTEKEIPTTELCFRIDEGPRTLVESVAIDGNTAISDETIQDQMLTRPPTLLHDGAFDPDVLDEDLYAATILYMRDGFQDRTITPELEFSEDRTAVDVTVNISEGPRTVVRQISIEGTRVVPETELRGALVHKAGGSFRQPDLDAEKEALASLVAEAGYPHARTDAEVTFSDNRTSADIVYRIDPGPQVILGDIFISGNLRTDEGLIRRELKVEPGSPLALRSLHDGQRQLRDLDIFNSVGYRTFGLKEKDDTVNLFVDIRERKPFYVEASTGYESDSGMYGRFKAGDRNLFGANKHLWGSAELSETGYRLETQLSDSRFLGTRTTASVGVFHEELTEFNHPFGTRTTGGSLNFSRSLIENLTGSLSFTVEQRRQFRVEDQETDTVDESARTVFVTTPSLTYDSRDSFVRPTKGLYSSFSIDISKGLHRQIDDYVRYQFDNRIYHSITDRITLAAMARIGQVTSYTDESDVPDDKLFYLGGIGDVRGYKENLLRYDSDGNAVGGKTAMVGSLEARIDLGLNFELTTFVDTGSVQDSLIDAGSDDFRTSVGLGLRYLTPIGPIGLLYGHKLDPHDDEASGRLHLSIGYTF